MWCLFFFCFKQKTAYEMRISDWSSDVCSSDLPERLDGVLQRRLVALQRLLLAGVVLVDDLLHRDGAGHGGLLPEQCRGGAEGKAGDMPHRLQQRRTHAVAHQQVLEGTQVDEFLRVHVLQGRRAGALAQHRKLAFVDTSGAVLPGRSEEHTSELQ